MPKTAPPRIVEVVASGHTLLGSIRSPGEKVLVEDSAFVVPSFEDQVARWGMVKIREVSADAPGVSEPKPRSWDDMSVSELSNLAAGFSDSELGEFRVWAHKAADGGNEAAATVLNALG